MQKEDLLRELRMLAGRVWFLDLAAYLIASCLIGFTVSMALGLLVGTALLFVELILLNHGIYRAAEGAAKHLKLAAFGNYALRLALIAVVFYAATRIPLINPYATVIPMFFPKFIYVGGALLTLKREKRGGGL